MDLSAHSGAEDKSDIEFDQEELSKLLKNADPRNRFKTLLDYMESSDLLQTVNPRMTYKDFDYENFSSKSWTDLGAKRVCIETGNSIDLPIKQRPGTS